MSTAQSQAETEKQKRDFIQKLVEIRRKQQRQKKESKAIKDIKPENSNITSSQMGLKEFSPTQKTMEEP